MAIQINKQKLQVSICWGTEGITQIRKCDLAYCLLKNIITDKLNKKSLLHLKKLWLAIPVTTIWFCYWKVEMKQITWRFSFQCQDKMYEPNIGILERYPLSVEAVSPSIQFYLKKEKDASSASWAKLWIPVTAGQMAISNFWLYLSNILRRLKCSQPVGVS